MSANRRAETRYTRILVVCLALPLALIVAAVLQHDRVVALGGTTGPVNVTVTPTDSLTDGQEITISATTTDATLTEIRAHVCNPAIPTLNAFNFSYQGDYCAHSSAAKRVNGSLGAGDYEAFTVFANTTAGSITFKAGLGAVTWNDETPGLPNPAMPDQHTLTCDATHPCDLIVRFQDSLGTHFFRAPLTYAGEGTTTTSSSTTTSSTTTSSTTTSSTTTSSTTTSTSSTTTTVPTTTTTTTVPASTTTTVPGPIGVNVAQGPVGSSFTVSSESWKAETPVEVTFNSTPIVLGSLVADADGVVHGTFAVPSVEPGSHTVKLAGTSTSGEPQVFSIGFTVTAASTPTSPLPGSSAGGTGSFAATTTGPLAFTGASSRDLASLGVLLLAVGVHLLALQRRRFTSA